MLARHSAWQRFPVALVVCAALGLPLLASQAQPLQRDRGRLILVLQLLHFVQWPGVAPGTPPSRFTFCVTSRDPWPTLLSSVVAEMTPDGHSVLIRPLRRPTEALGCSAVLTSGLMDREQRDAWRDLPMLTIGLDEGFARSGGMVNLVQVNGKVSFEVNTAAAERAGLRFSSKIVRIATIVKETP